MLIEGSSSVSNSKPPPPAWVRESVGAARGLSCSMGSSSGEHATDKTHKRTAAIALKHNDNRPFGDDV